METQGAKGVWMKRVLVGLGVVAGGFALFLYVGIHIPDYLRWKYERDARAYDAALAAERAQLEAMEKADTYGSTTPEGTAELIVAALEKGDTLLASKYYYVLDQEKAKASFDNQLTEKGDLNTAISFYKDLLRGTKGCNEAGDGCTLEYEFFTERDTYIDLINNPQKQFLPKGSPQVKANNFILNKYSNVWKAVER